MQPMTSPESFTVYRVKFYDKGIDPDGGVFIVVVVVVVVVAAAGAVFL